MSAAGQLDIGVPQTGSSRLSVVAELINKYLADFPDVHNVLLLEIGTYEGNSAVFMSHVIGDAGRSGTVVCIDPWAPYLAEGVGEPASRMNRELASGLVFERFLENRKHAHPQVKLRYFVGTVEGFGGKLGAFDIVYVDGCHRFNPCLTDISKGFSFLKPGGLICGDDLEKQVPFDDPEVFSRCDEEYVDGYHPGVSLAVAAFFGPALVWSRDSIWAMRKTADGGFTQEGVL